MMFHTVVASAPVRTGRMTSFTMPSSMSRGLNMCPAGSVGGPRPPPPHYPHQHYYHHYHLHQHPPFPPHYHHPPHHNPPQHFPPPYQSIAHAGTPQSSSASALMIYQQQQQQPLPLPLPPTASAAAAPSPSAVMSETLVETPATFTPMQVLCAVCCLRSNSKPESTFINPVAKETVLQGDVVCTPPQSFRVEEPLTRPTTLSSTEPRRMNKKKTLSGGSLRSPAVKRSAQSPITQQGWLYKQGSEGLMLWKKRWFILSDFCLFYYKGPGDDKTLGSILLPSYKISPCTTDDRIYRKYAFKAEHHNMRTYYFAAETKDAMLQWMNAMSLASILQKNSGFSEHSDVITDCGSLDPNLVGSVLGTEDEDSGFTSYHSRRQPGSPQQDISTFSDSYAANDAYRSRMEDSLRDSTSENSYPEGYLGTGDKYPNPTYSSGHHVSPHVHSNAFQTGINAAPVLMPHGNRQHLYANAPPKPKRMGGAADNYAPECDGLRTTIMHGNFHEYPEKDRLVPHVHHTRSIRDASPVSVVRLDDYQGPITSQRRTPDPYARTTAPGYEYTSPSGRPEQPSQYSDEYAATIAAVAGQMRALGHDEYLYSPRRQTAVESLPQRMQKSVNRANRPHSADFLEYDLYGPQKNPVAHEEVLHPKRSKAVGESANARPKSNIEGCGIVGGYPDGDIGYQQQPPATGTRLNDMYDHRSEVQSGGDRTPRETVVSRSSAKHNMSFESYLSKEGLYSPNVHLSDPYNDHPDMNRSRHAESVYSAAVLSQDAVRHSPTFVREPRSDVSRTLPRDRSFIRSASARLPSATSMTSVSSASTPTRSREDTRWKVQQREESMKRLLEWKQRMLQSPLTKKYPSKSLSQSHLMSTSLPSSSSAMSALASTHNVTKPTEPLKIVHSSTYGVTSIDTRMSSSLDSSRQQQVFKDLSGRDPSLHSHVIQQQPKFVADNRGGSWRDKNEAGKLRDSQETAATQKVPKVAKVPSRSPSRTQDHRHSTSSLNRNYNSYSSDDEDVKLQEQHRGVKCQPRVEIISNNSDRNVSNLKTTSSTTKMADYVNVETLNQKVENAGDEAQLFVDENGLKNPEYVNVHQMKHDVGTVDECDQKFISAVVLSPGQTVSSAVVRRRHYSEPKISVYQDYESEEEEEDKELEGENLTQVHLDDDEYCKTKNLNQSIAIRSNYIPNKLLQDGCTQTGGWCEMLVAPCEKIAEVNCQTKFLLDKNYTTEFAATGLQTEVNKSVSTDNHFVDVSSAKEISNNPELFSAAFDRNWEQHLSKSFQRSCQRDRSVQWQNPNDVSANYSSICYDEHIAGHVEPPEPFRSPFSKPVNFVGCGGDTFKLCSPFEQNSAIPSVKIHDVPSFPSIATSVSRDTEPYWSNDEQGTTEHPNQHSDGVLNREINDALSEYSQSTRDPSKGSVGTSENVATSLGCSVLTQLRNKESPPKNIVQDRIKIFESQADVAASSGPVLPKKCANLQSRPTETANAECQDFDSVKISASKESSSIYQSANRSFRRRFHSDTETLMYESTSSSSSSQSSLVDDVEPEGLCDGSEENCETTEKSQEIMNPQLFMNTWQPIEKAMVTLELRRVCGPNFSHLNGSVSSRNLDVASSYSPPGDSSGNVDPNVAEEYYLPMNGSSLGAFSPNGKSSGGGGGGGVVLQTNAECFSSNTSNIGMSMPRSWLFEGGGTKCLLHDSEEAVYVQMDDATKCAKQLQSQQHHSRQTSFSDGSDVTTKSGADQEEDKADGGTGKDIEVVQKDSPASSMMLDIGLPPSHHMSSGGNCVYYEITDSRLSVDAPDESGHDEPIYAELKHSSIALPDSELPSKSDDREVSPCLPQRNTSTSFHLSRSRTSPVATSGMLPQDVASTTIIHVTRNVPINRRKRKELDLPKSMDSASDADDEGSKDFELNPRFSLSDSFRPASYYLKSSAAAKTKKNQRDRTSDEEMEDSPPPVPSSPPPSLTSSDAERSECYSKKPVKFSGSFSGGKPMHPSSDAQSVCLMHDNGDTDLSESVSPTSPLNLKLNYSYYRVYEDDRRITELAFKPVPAATSFSSRSASSSPTSAGLPTSNSEPSSQRPKLNLSVRNVRIYSEGRSPAIHKYHSTFVSSDDVAGLDDCADTSVACSLTYRDAETQWSPPVSSSPDGDFNGDIGLPNDASSMAVGPFVERCHSVGSCNNSVETSREHVSPSDNMKRSPNSAPYYYSDLLRDDDVVDNDRSSSTTLVTFERGHLRALPFPPSRATGNSRRQNMLNNRRSVSSVSIGGSSGGVVSGRPDEIGRKVNNIELAQNREQLQQVAPHSRACGTVPFHLSHDVDHLRVASELTDSLVYVQAKKLAGAERNTYESDTLKKSRNRGVWQDPAFYARSLAWDRVDLRNLYASGISRDEMLRESSFSSSVADQQIQLHQRLSRSLEGLLDVAPPIEDGFANNLPTFGRTASHSNLLDRECEEEETVASNRMDSGYCSIQNQGLDLERDCTRSRILSGEQSDGRFFCNHRDDFSVPFVGQHQYVHHFQNEDVCRVSSYLSDSQLEEYPGVVHRRRRRDRAECGLPSVRPTSSSFNHFLGKSHEEIESEVDFDNHPSLTQTSLRGYFLGKHELSDFDDGTESLQPKQDEEEDIVLFSMSDVSSSNVGDDVYGELVASDDCLITEARKKCSMDDVEIIIGSNQSLLNVGKESCCCSDSSIALAEDSSYTDCRCLSSRNQIDTGSVHNQKENRIPSSRLPSKRRHRTGDPSAAAANLKTVREDANVSDSEVHAEMKLHNVKVRKYLNEHNDGDQNHVKLSISAGDLLGKTHEELVLLLIQLRRDQVKLEQEMHNCRMEIEAENKLLQFDCSKRGEHLERQKLLVKQCEEYSKQYDLTKPLVNLVDNMVKLGSLYGGSEQMLVAQNEADGHPPEEYSLPKKMIEFSRQLQEKRLMENERIELENLTPDQVDLEVKLDKLCKLDQMFHEESHIVSGLQQGKDLLEKAVESLKAKVDTCRDNPVELEKLQKQLRASEKELSKLRNQLTFGTKKLEETAADNAKIENEILILRQKMQSSLKQSLGTASLSEASNVKVQLEKELSRISDVMESLAWKREELSGALEQLKDRNKALLADVRSSPTGVSGAIPLPGRKNHRSTYLETDLDTMETRDTVENWQHGDVIAPTLESQHNTGVPLYVNMYNRTGNHVSPAGLGSEKVDLDSSVEYGNAESDAYEPQDINDADDKMKRFYGILPREKPAEIKTVRIVKRESERRSKERDRRKPGCEGDLPLTKLTENGVALNYFEDSELSEEMLSSQRSMSLPRSYGQSSHLYRGLYCEPGVQPLTVGVSTTTSTRPSPSSLIPSTTNKNVYYYRTPSLSSAGCESPLSAHERLFGIPVHGASSVSLPSPTTTTSLSTPTFKSEAARKIVAETAHELASTLMMDVPVNGDGELYPLVTKYEAGSLKRRQKRRHYTISSSQPLILETVSQKMVNARSRDDLDMERCLRSANTPDVVKSTIKKNEAFDASTIDRELGLPQKIVIPERYVEEEDEELTPAEQLHRLQKAESIRKMLSESTAYGDVPPEEVQQSATLKKKVEAERRQREHLLALNQIIAKEVMERSKAVAAKAMKNPPKASSPAEDDDLSPEQTLPLIQQRENLLT